MEKLNTLFLITLLSCLGLLLECLDKSSKVSVVDCKMLLIKCLVQRENVF